MNPLLQSLIVALVVVAACFYSAWTLMPAAWRRGLATWLLRRPVLARSPALQAAARPASGCGACGDCGSGATPPPAGAERPIHVLRRSP